MNADRLLAHYEKISDAPDAIPRLRRFILDLAVRGKLVEQDPNDEPASELLKRIATEKARLVKAGEIRKEKPLPEIETDELQFAAPRGWKWARIRKVTSDRGQMVPDQDFTYVDVTAINKEVGRIEEAKMTSASEAPSRARKIICQGDVLYSCVRPYLLNIAIVETDISPPPIASTAFAVLNGFGSVLPRYQWIVLRSPFFVTCVEQKMRGQAYPAINDSDFALLPFPLPPLAEQHRIIAKADELMALCEQLEAARTKRETTRDRLTAASLARLDAPDPDPAVFQNHAAFALDNLIPLTTRPDQIKALRQTILNLAVRGKLVEQNPNDEPAWKLLARIRTAKTEQKRKTGDARIKTAPEANCGSLPFELPNDWSAQSFENLFLFIDYRGKTPPKRDNGIALITAKNVRMGHLDREPREYVSDATFRTWMTRGFPRIGDLFFTTEAPLGNVCLNDIDEPFALAQRVICMQPYADINTRFLMYGLMSDSIQSLINAHATGLTAKGIKAAKLKPLPILIPPLAEQHRIVAKVDELMTLCDRLEANLATGDYTRCRLLDALLHEALAPSEEKSGSIIPTIAQKAPDKPPGSPKMLTEPKPAGTSPA